MSRLSIMPNPNQEKILNLEPEFLTYSRF